MKWGTHGAYNGIGLSRNVSTNTCSRSTPPPFHILPLAWLFTLGKGKMGGAWRLSWNWPVQECFNEHVLKIDTSTPSYGKVHQHGKDRFDYLDVNKGVRCPTSGGHKDPTSRTQVPPPLHILPLVWLFTLGKGNIGAAWCLYCHAESVRTARACRYHHPCIYYP